MIPLLVLPDAETAGRAAASLLAWEVRAAAAERGRATLACSGGTSPWPMYRHLGGSDVPWDAVTVLQVDERVAPEGHPDRNLTHLRAALPARARLSPLPVEAVDLEAAAGSLAVGEIDVVHLGLGGDGHTASLLPGDPVLDVEDRDVALTGPYQGRHRMTLTYPALARARRVVWLVVGEARREPLARLLGGDPGIPAGRVRADRAIVVADTAAAPDQA